MDGVTTIFPSENERQQYKKLFANTNIIALLGQAFAYRYQDLDTPEGFHFISRRAQAISVDGVGGNLTGGKLDDRWLRAVIHAKHEVLLAEYSLIGQSFSFWSVPPRIRAALARSFVEWAQVRAANVLRNMKWWGK